MRRDRPEIDFTLLDETRRVSERLSEAETPAQRRAVRVGTAVRMAGFACLAGALLALCLGSPALFSRLLIAGIVLPAIGLAIGALG